MFQNEIHIRTFHKNHIKEVRAHTGAELVTWFGWADHVTHNSDPPTFLPYFYSRMSKPAWMKYPRPQASTSIRQLRVWLLSASFSRWRTAKTVPTIRAEELTGDEARNEVYSGILYTPPIKVIYFVLREEDKDIQQQFSIFCDEFNPIQTGLFWPSLDLGGGGGRQTPHPLRFLKTIKDIDMKLTPLIKRRETNLLLVSYLSCDVI